MKLLTVLVCTILSLVSFQPVIAQSNGRATESLFVIAAISNAVGSVQRTVHTLPSGKERVIYDFHPKIICKKGRK